MNSSPSKLLRLRQFIPNLIPIGVSTWWAGVRSGRFPKPIKLGPRTSAWKESDILALVEALEKGGSIAKEIDSQK